MTNEEVREWLEAGLQQLVDRDRHLFENNLSERCIASRLAMYLQSAIADYSVDVEYNRKGASPKKLDLPEACANSEDDNGEKLVVPDIIVHSRGEEGPNILAIEVKKTTNRKSWECDHIRIHAFRAQLEYRAAALIKCETRPGHKPSATIIEWL
jgi:hypothetical protein